MWSSACTATTFDFRPICAVGVNINPCLHGWCCTKSYCREKKNVLLLLSLPPTPFAAGGRNKSRISFYTLRRLSERNESSLPPKKIKLSVFPRSLTSCARRLGCCTHVKNVFGPLVHFGPLPNVKLETLSCSLNSHLWVYYTFLVCVGRGMGKGKKRVFSSLLVASFFMLCNNICSVYKVKTWHSFWHRRFVDRWVKREREREKKSLSRKREMGSGQYRVGVCWFVFVQSKLSAGQKRHTQTHTTRRIQQQQQHTHTQTCTEHTGREEERDETHTAFTHT